MDITRLNAQIETAVAIEAKEGHLANYLLDRAAANGGAWTDARRREALELFEDYVRSVPTLLAAASTAAAGTPVEATMEKVIAAAVTYWDEPDDLVPDELGVLGLLDDAYFSLRMLQMVSARLREESGQVLVADDLSALDEVVRGIIGEQLADVLDELVILSLSSAPVDELLATIEQHAGSFTLASAASSFAGMSVAELVEQRLRFDEANSSSLRGDLAGALESFAAKLSGPPSAELVREGSETIAAVVVAALGDAAMDEGADGELITALLVGAAVSRATLGQSCDREFIASCVDMVLASVT